MNKLSSTLVAIMLLFISSISFSQNEITITDDDLNGNGSFTWTNNNTYILDGLVFLEAGGLLAIEPGTVIKGKNEPSTGDLTSGLIITRGAQIFARGIPDNPIIFTAESDDLSDPNDLNCTQDRGLWGGLIILGNAVLGNQTTEGQIEGIPASEPRGTFGGTNDDESSGVLQYVSIRHSGASLSPGNEINGLTLGGVGQNTSIDHIEVIASLDDGIQIFGGTVNIKYAAVAFCGDDAFEWDMGWRGNGQFWFGILGTDTGDGGAVARGGTPPDQSLFSNPTLCNVTLIGPGCEDIGTINDIALYFSGASAGKISNSIFSGFNKGIEVNDAEANFTSKDQLLIGELVLDKNIWFGFCSGDSFDSEGLIRVSENAEDPTAQFLINHLANNQNQVADPLFTNISRSNGEALDPRPQVGSPAFENLSDKPDNPFFESVKFKGAFGNDVWFSGWSALSGCFDVPENCNLTIDTVLVECPHTGGSVGTGSANILISGDAPPYNIQYGLVGTEDPIEIGPISDKIAQIANLLDGEYAVVLTDANGCTDASRFVIEPDDCVLEVIVNKSDISCPGEQDGRVEFIISGGITAYSFNFNNQVFNILSDTTLIFNDLGPIEYTYTVNNECGCGDGGNGEIEEPNDFEVSCRVTNKDDISPQFTNGAVELNINGGIPPYIVSWELGNTTQDTTLDTGGIHNIGNLEGGRSYTFNVSDANSCVGSCTDSIGFVFRVVKPAGDSTASFIVEFSESVTSEYIFEAERAYFEGIQPGETMIRTDSCQCFTDDLRASRLQSWSTTRNVIELEINTGTMGTTSNEQYDTSGVNVPLIIPELDSIVLVNSPTGYCIPLPNGNGTSPVVISIIDTGIDLLSQGENENNGHDNLKGLEWRNLGEAVANRSGIGKDDDGNCLIDDLEGFDWIGETAVIKDDIGHGTHIAGIVAGGLPDKVDLQIINQKIFRKLENDSIESNLFDLICAIHYAVDNGAKVINLSLGYSKSEPSITFYNALKRAQENDVVIIVSAGNDKKNLDTVKPDSIRWPVKFQTLNSSPEFQPLTNLITVAALDTLNEDLDLRFSNYGQNSIDLAAPGTFRSTIPIDTFETYSGTSMAAAYMTHLVSIVRAIKPNLTHNQVINNVFSAVDSFETDSKNLLRYKGKINADRLFQRSRITQQDLLRAQPPILNTTEIKQKNNMLRLSGDPFEAKLGLAGDIYESVLFIVNTVGTNDNIYVKEFCFTNAIVWDGRDENGDPLPKAVYDFIIQIGEITYDPASFKITILD